VVYFEIGRGRALVQENRRIRLGVFWMLERLEDTLEVGEDGFGWRIQILGA
jgi:hypothetical protein